jgi:hypothetical protein
LSLLLVALKAVLWYAVALPAIVLGSIVGVCVLWRWVHRRCRKAKSLRGNTILITGKFQCWLFR